MRNPYVLGSLLALATAPWDIGVRKSKHAKGKRAKSKAQKHNAKRRAIAKASRKRNR